METRPKSRILEELEIETGNKTAYTPGTEWHENFKGVAAVEGVSWWLSCYFQLLKSASWERGLQDVSWRLVSKNNSYNHFIYKYDNLELYKDNLYTHTRKCFLSENVQSDVLDNKVPLFCISSRKDDHLWKL